MFRYMPRSGYRSGEKRVDVWLSVAQHARLRELAAGWECSLSDAVGRLVREEVARDGGAGAGSGGGVLAASGGRRSRDVPGGGGVGDPVVVAAHEPVDEVTGQTDLWDMLTAEPRTPVLRVVDDWESA